MTEIRDRGLIWCLLICGVSEFDGDFWLEGSKSVLEESNKLSFR